MINKLKIGFLITVMALFGGFGYASAADLNFDDTYAKATVNGNDYYITSGSAATSIAIDGTTLTVVVPASTTFTLVSPGRHTLANDGGYTATCTNTESTLVINAAGTVVITPSTTACGAITAGGGGGGGGGAPAPTPTPTPTPAPTTPATPATPGNEIPGCGNRTTGFSTSSGVSCVGNTPTTPATPATPGNVIPGCGNRTTGFSTSSGVSCAGNTAGTSATPSSSNGYAFGTTLVKQGTKGEACKAWQMFLNDHANAGLVVDGWCGNLTITAAKSWQTSVGLTADGKLGAMSRAKAMMQWN